jgi:hypothetical protein
MVDGVTAKSSASRRGVKFSKNERLRRLRLGDLHRLLRDRCGPTLPDDDAGREYLKELLLPISLGPAEARNGSGGMVKVWTPTDKMRREIEQWAPWMSKDEADLLLDEINRMPPWERMVKAGPLGQRLRLTFAERARLDLRTIGPCDMTKKVMVEIRRQKRRQRERLRRQSQGSKPRSEYLAASISRTKPWIAAGFNTRRTWERNGKPNVASPCPISLTNTKHALATKDSLRGNATQSGDRLSNAHPCWADRDLCRGLWSYGRVVAEGRVMNCGETGAALRRDFNAPWARTRPRGLTPIIRRSSCCLSLLTKRDSKKALNHGDR